MYAGLIPRQTVLPQVRRLRAEFVVEQMVVGDRGMISHQAIEQFKRVPGLPGSRP